MKNIENYHWSFLMVKFAKKIVVHQRGTILFSQKTQQSVLFLIICYFSVISDTVWQIVCSLQLMIKCWKNVIVCLFSTLWLTRIILEFAQAQNYFAWIQFFAILEVILVSEPKMRLEMSNGSLASLPAGIYVLQSYYNAYEFSVANLGFNMENF